MGSWVFIQVPVLLLLYPIKDLPDTTHVRNKQWSRGVSTPPRCDFTPSDGQQDKLSGGGWSLDALGVGVRLGDDVIDGRASSRCRRGLKCR